MYDLVRLPKKSIDAIIFAFKQNFAEDDHLWIFGSRVNLQAKGGDIDLYVETPETNVELVYNRKVKFVGDLWKQIGEQKIDVVLRFTRSDLNLAIYQVALKDGVKLV
jgi:hypothetical protein